MPINRADLEQPEEREVINLAATDLEAKKATFTHKAGKAIKHIPEMPGEIIENTSRHVENFAISRRDFLKWLGIVAGGSAVVALAVIGVIKREGIIQGADEFFSKFSVVEEKPIDPRIIETFGKDYPEWASGQAQGQYGLYLMGNADNGFNITNIPQLGDKDNIVWLLTYQYGAIWPFVTPERDGDVLDQELYPLPSEDSFVNRIVDDLGLDDKQGADLLRRWRFLSVDPKAVVGWLEDLKSQGVKSVTDEMIKFYSDPTTFMTTSNR